MKFSLLVLSHPSSEPSLHAYQFARSVISGGHQLYRVFFYGDGVLNSTHSESEGYPVNKLWQQLGQAYHADLSVCSTAAIKRGITAADNTSSQAGSQLNLLSGFTLSGLGQLIDANSESDRLITFG